MPASRPAARRSPPRIGAPPATPRAQLRGAVRLAADAVVGVAGAAESLHQRIASLAPPVGRHPEAPTRGITGLVYRSIRGTTRAVHAGLDRALAAWPEPASVPQPSATREALLAALNGIVGDHLADSGNPLAIPLALTPRDGPPMPVLVVLLHGLCMTPHQWQRAGADLGRSLAAALHASAVDVRYNSGRAIGSNGRELAQALEVLVREWPVPVRRIVLVGHSMGGLVARSATHQAQEAGLRWPQRLTDLVFLGTPHHGAVLERGGHWLHAALGVSPYLAPFGRIAGQRSAGITDLRHGSFREPHRGADRHGPGHRPMPEPLPTRVRCHAVAGRLGPRLRSDGLVGVASALGHHRQPARDLGLAPGDCLVADGVGHLDLLCSPVVEAQLCRWLAPA